MSPPRTSIFLMKIYTIRTRVQKIQPGFNFPDVSSLFQSRGLNSAGLHFSWYWETGSLPLVFTWSLPLNATVIVWLFATHTDCSPPVSLLFGSSGITEGCRASSRDFPTRIELQASLHCRFYHRSHHSFRMPLSGSLPLLLVGSSQSRQDYHETTRVCFPDEIILSYWILTSLASSLNSLG